MRDVRLQPVIVVISIADASYLSTQEFLLYHERDTGVDIDYGDMDG